jgi:hypothetical protein
MQFRTPPGYSRDADQRFLPLPYQLAQQIRS